MGSRDDDSLDITECEHSSPPDSPSVAPAADTPAEIQFSPVSSPCLDIDPRLFLPLPVQQLHGDQLGSSRSKVQAALRSTSAEWSSPLQASDEKAAVRSADQVHLLRIQLGLALNENEKLHAKLGRSFERTTEIEEMLAMTSNMVEGATQRAKHLENELDEVNIEVENADADRRRMQSVIEDLRAQLRNAQTARVLPAARVDHFTGTTAIAIDTMEMIRTRRRELDEARRLWLQEQYEDSEARLSSWQSKFGIVLDTAILA